MLSPELEIARAENLCRTIDAIFSPLPYRPRRQTPAYATTLTVSEIGRKWDAEVHFTADGSFRNASEFDPAEEPEIEVTQLTFDGKTVDYELLTCETQDKIIAACIEAVSA